MGCRLFILLAFFVLTVPAGLPVRAEPFWIAYEGNDFPENEGWDRNFGNQEGPGKGGALRSLSDGVFRISGLADNQIYDVYELDQPIALDERESLLVEFRLRIDPFSDEDDVGAAIGISDPPGLLGIQFGPTAIYSSFENLEFGIDMTGFREIAIQSDDLIHYLLHVDGNLIWSGVWDSFVSMDSFVGWGDAVQGRRSASEWDYFRVGVIPEAATSSYILVACAWAFYRRPRDAR